MVVLDMKPENAKFWVGDYEYYKDNVFFNACKCANPNCQNLIQLANPVEVKVKDPKVMQAAQEERMAGLQNMMIQQAASQAERPTVTGVKTATGSSGDAMQIARRGVSGTFGRRGMRISSLNV